MGHAREDAGRVNRMHGRVGRSRQERLPGAGADAMEKPMIT